MENGSADGERALSAGVPDARARMKRRETFCLVVGFASKEWAVLLHDRLDAVSNLGGWTCKVGGHGGGEWAL
eukprot:7125983-Prorocentrum_lima.AAC.1